MEKLIKINDMDNVAVAAQALAKGETTKVCGGSITAAQDIPFGHKIALRGIRRGEIVVKYGSPIGKASQDIPAGTHVHSHNLITGLSGRSEYSYSPAQPARVPAADLSFEGYLRGDGRVGIRNEIWIIPTVGCINKLAERIALEAGRRFADKCGGVFAFTHPYGCSQLGEDLECTRKILAGLVRHPNAGGVLVLGLGCENNNIASFRAYLGDVDGERIKFLSAQDASDETEQALALIAELAEKTAADRRTELPLGRLTVGFKCGGSDAFSGITANPLCGRVTDTLTASGGRAILTEVPEMFGAETRLFGRCRDRGVFDAASAMINGFKDYYLSHSQPVYENPSPGNKAGGITTLEEKSLGCIEKGGSAEVTDVLGYGGTCREPGLTLLTGPGNDMVSCTNLTAAGANLILFTTGRGTPFGAPVPTIKISSNSQLSGRKPNWIDYDAGRILSGKSFGEAAGELLRLITSTASGEKTKNELSGCREIAIFKDGVTL